MEYHDTKDILHVMKMLGHRNIQNTLLYTQLVSFENDHYHSATAKSVEDVQKLVESGFEYCLRCQRCQSIQKTQVAIVTNGAAGNCGEAAGI